MNQSNIGLIHGPPGTGKTKTVCELITYAISKKLKILATANSNIAVDNIVERLNSKGVKTCRIGHPARILESIT